MRLNVFQAVRGLKTWTDLGLSVKTLNTAVFLLQVAVSEDGRLSEQLLGKFAKLVWPPFLCLNCRTFNSIFVL